MHRKYYQPTRLLIVFYVAIIVAFAILRDSYLLALTGILTGIIFILLARLGAKVKTDEREATIQEKAARMTYAIFTPTIAIAASLFLLPSKGGLAVFSRGEWLYLESLGSIFAYLALFIITLYSISYRIFSRKYQGDNEE